MTEDAAADPFADPVPVGGSRVSDPTVQLSLDLADHFFAVDPDDLADGAPPVFEVHFRQTDFPIDGLVKRMEDARIVVPKFQREFVWPRDHAERFIESLLLGLPVPAIFLARDPNGDQLLVVDGHQRLATIRAFYSGFLDGKPFSLDSVESRFKGRTYKTLDSHDRGRLDDAAMTGNVLRQDAPENDFSSVYFMFERLNSGSLRLTRHEIRRAVNQGALSDFIDEVAEHPTWIGLMDSVRRPGGLSALEHRSRSRETVLRWIAFLVARDDYAVLGAVPATDPPGKESHSVVLFLDRFMRGHRHDSGEDNWAPAIRSALADLRPLAALRWPHAVSPNRAMFEAMLVAFAETPARSEAHIMRFRELGGSPILRDMCTDYTSRLDKVENRHQFARAALDDLAIGLQPT